MTKESANQMENQKNFDRLNMAYRLFYDALMEGGIERIVVVAYQVFNRPVLVTDANYHLICQFPKASIGNAIWDQMYENKILPAETIWEYQVKYLNDHVDMYKPFYADWGIVEDCPRIFGEITNHKQILGHIAIFLMDQPLEDDDLEIAQIFIDTLRIEITKRQSSYGNWSSSFSTYLLDLLDPSVSFSEKHIARERLQHKIAGNYILITTPNENKASQKAFASYLVIEFAQRYRNVVSVLYEDCMVTLIGGVYVNKGKFQNSSLTTEIINILEKHDLISGRCDCFSQLDEIHLRYRQALLTAKIAIAKKDTSLGTFMDYAPMQMFLEFTGKDIPKIYIHPVLDQIRKYDLENNAEYYNTLRTYIMSICNRNTTATQLSIHRNTLSYRLNYIRDLFDLSFEDEKTVLHLICSFLLIEANNMM